MQHLSVVTGTLVHVFSIFSPSFMIIACESINGALCRVKIHMVLQDVSSYLQHIAVILSLREKPLHIHNYVPCG